MVVAPHSSALTVAFRSCWCARSILLDRRMGLEAVLCDFELLKEEAKGTGGQTTILGGTPAYMAPERLKDPNKRPEKSADMYSVGVVMLFCFAPFRIEDVIKDKTANGAMAVLSQVRSEIPEAVSGYIDNLLSFNPDKRPSARSMLGQKNAAGEVVDSYFSRAEMELPPWWDANKDEMIIEVPPNSFTMQALRRAIAPQQPDEFGKGFDAGAKPWLDINLPLLSAPGTCKRHPGGSQTPNMRAVCTCKSERGIKIMKAWRVQNEQIWKTYATARERVADDVSHGPPIDSNEPPICNRAKLMQPKQDGIVAPGCSKGGLNLEEAGQNGFTQSGEDAIRRDVNEAFLLHGMPKETLADVLRTGFNERYSGANAGALCVPPSSAKSGVVLHDAIR